MQQMPKVIDIPYTLIDGKSHHARIIPIAVSLEGLNDEEIQVVGHLAEAVQSITPIFARQSYDNILDLFAALEKMETAVKGKEKEEVADYNTLFAVRNGIWEYKGDQSFMFPLSKDKASEYLSSSMIEALFHKDKAPKGRALYPKDITEKEFDALGEEKNIVNSSIIRDEKQKVKVLMHEQRYKKEVQRIITALTKVLSLTKNDSLKEYIQSKIEELTTGTSSSRERANLAWLQLSGKIDLSLSTGLETYLDRFKGVRGVAQGGVFRERPEYQKLCQQVINVLQELEENAPWKEKKQINLLNVPKLRFVDVITWAGFYETFPGAVIAQSLPNEKEFKDKHGSVNFVFTNIQESMGKWGIGDLLKKEFFLDEEMRRYSDLMITTNLKLTAFHEIGHTMGGVKIKEEPSVYFGAEYSLLEEARAELISLWMLPYFVKKGILKPEEEFAGYYAMLLAILGGMRMKPVDHAGSRNMMFYYLLEHGAIAEKQAEGKIKFVVQQKHIKEVVKKMLATLGDIKATGDKEGLQQFKEKYLSTARQQEFQERLKHLPLGGGFIFPTLSKDKQKYTGELVYPESFRQQPRTLSYFTEERRNVVKTSNEKEDFLK